MQSGIEERGVARSLRSVLFVKFTVIGDSTMVGVVVLYSSGKWTSAESKTNGSNNTAEEEINLRNERLLGNRLIARKKDDERSQANNIITTNIVNNLQGNVLGRKCFLFLTVSEEFYP